MFTLAETKAKMHELIEKKRADAAEVDAKTATAEADLREALTAMETAAAELDTAAYEAASQHKAAAERALSMLTAKASQLQHHRYITEAESDAYIDAILDHERGLSEQFQKTAAKLLDQLDHLHKVYAAAIADDEQLLTVWQSQVHPNYRGSSTMYFDPETGTHTNRSPMPTPVHFVQYAGCDAAVAIRRAIDGLNQYRSVKYDG